MAHGWVMNGLLSMYERPSYLEVGVHAGLTFVEARAARKVAVDPKIRFGAEAATAPGEQVELQQMTSDRYFGEVARGREKFDVIFIDGLHTFEQTLRDLLNAVEVLQPQGVILIDDVLPDSELAALRDDRDAIRRRNEGEAWNGHWMGDVYRLVWFIETFMQGWSYGGVQEGLGQLLIWRAPRPSVPDRRMTEVAELSYAEMRAAPETFRWAPFDTVRSEAARSLGLPAGR
jgi:hypothetical protein